MISYDIYLHQYFCNLQKIFTPFRKKTMETRIIKNISNKNERRCRFTPFRKKTMETRIIKNISNKNERRCRDVKTQKACEQG